MGDVLRSANWLPAQQLGDEELSASDNLLATVADLWHAATPAPTKGARARQTSRRLDWMNQQLAAGARLTADLPRTMNETRRNLADSEIAGRLCWWPRGIPEGRWVAIVSSRLGRRLDQRPEWFDVFRAACAKIDTQNSVLLTGAQTTTARFAERAAELFNLPTLVVREPHSGDTLLSWLRKIRQSQSSRNAACLYEAFLSPPLIPQVRQQGGAPATLPLCDRVVIAWADQLFVAHLRRGGNQEQLIRARLVESVRNAPDVFVALGPRLVPRALADELLGLGAVGWVLLPQREREATVDFPSDAASDRRNSAELSKFSSAEPFAANAPTNLDLPASQVISFESFIADQRGREWNFLTHCTRTPAGPWPEQSDQEFLDELLSQGRPEVRSPLAAITRIVAQQRIIASAAALRGGTPAVCFTAVPLGELHRLRVFQPQRQCWDFEPYGICVQRNWLVTHGARAVTYGDEDDWEALPAADRPFFQRRETRRGIRRREWTHECEWRHLGDVDLSLVPADSAVVFVPSACEAERLALVSRWPVVVCR